MSKCILVTGANGGLGLATAKYFLDNDSDAFVYLGTRSNRMDADTLVESYAGRSKVITLDVTLRKDWQNALECIQSDGRVVNVLVNNAGHHSDGLLAMMSEESWSEVIDSNLNSVYHGTQVFLSEMMKQRFGRIINISSLSGIMAPKGQTNYAAAKAGVIAMSQSLAKEVARAGVTVNCICPGYINTGALDEIGADQLPMIKKTIPMRRFGNPEEVASAIFFLASDDAGYITGATIKIDGGIF